MNPKNLENTLLEEYDDCISILIHSKQLLKQIIQSSRMILSSINQGKKIVSFGNGGSAAIASHFSIDLTKNAKIRCTNYNESDLITCFSNDFGYER